MHYKFCYHYFLISFIQIPFPKEKHNIVKNIGSMIITTIIIWNINFVEACSINTLKVGHCIILQIDVIVSWQQVSKLVNKVSFKILLLLIAAYPNITLYTSFYIFLVSLFFSFSK